MAKQKARTMLSNDGGLVVTGPGECAGYLWFVEGRAYDPCGLIHGVTTKEMAEEHNRVLDVMTINGLDESCHVGQGDVFYVHESSRTVTTCNGAVLGPLTVKRRRGFMRTFEFTRSGRRFLGRCPANYDGSNVFFRRVA